VRVRNIWLQWKKQQIECLPGNYSRYRSMKTTEKKRKGKEQYRRKGGEKGRR